MKKSETLQKKIQNKSAKIAVVGLGYVGLPLAVEFANAGFDVTGIDVSADKVKKINKGQNYIDDVDSKLMKSLVKSGKLIATTNFATMKKIDCVSICVPTPLGKTGDPDISYMLAARDAILPHVKSPLLFVLESTTYPGSTNELIIPLMEEKGLKVGEDVFIAFSPERVDPGNPVYQTHNTPKVVGGVTKTCTKIAAELYSTVIEKIIPVSSCTAAEMTKLLENTFRSINIGLANEIAIMCKYLDVDVWEVINAAATKPFGFMPFYPGPGLGGHCIPIDPLYLSWKLKTLDYKARFIELADEVNSSMPEYVIALISDALNDKAKSIKKSKILILGMAYKKDIDDLRESPALDVYEYLESRGAKVSYHDPYVPQFKWDGGIIKSKVYSDKLIKSQDCVVILTAHSNIDYKAVVKNAKLVVDTRNATQGIKNKKIVKL
ncbi:MAG: UDP-N-acetyl-D-glucosamine dehydrogenase [Chlamydiae bacterium]|nr:MAG: UDP-N-acetyl-D-glucosamine dehydrogenase [Chlamydiota bacterium]